MVVADYVFSQEGQLFLEEFNRKFDCQFRYDEPGSDFVVDTDNKTYKIPKNETIEVFKSLIIESVKSGKNILVSRYNLVEYDANVEY